MITTDETEDAFTALSDATRIEILRTLWDSDDNEATFTELRETVGMRDSGQFNYHLDKLTGRFVRKTDEGYELTIAGQLVYGSILSGAYSGEKAIEPIPLDEHCPACGGDRTIAYEDETITVECNSCDLTSSVGVPPGVFVGYDPAEIPDVADRYFRTIVQQVDNGFCWYCEGRIEPAVEPMAESIDDEQEEDWGITDDDTKLPVVKYGCERCSIEITVNLGNSMLTHPAVVSFYYDHGIHVGETSIWEFAAWSTDRTCIVGRDPFRARVVYDVGGERLTIDVDDRLQVTSIDRSDA